MVVVVRWQHGNQPAYSALDNTWIQCYFSGSATFGLNPVINWNADNAEYPGIHLNVRIQTRLHATHPFELDVLIGSGLMAPEQFYTELWQPEITWSNYLDPVSFVYIPGVEPPGPYILDETVEVAVGTYERLLANTCKV